MSVEAICNKLKLLIVSDSPTLPRGTSGTIRLLFETLIHLYPDSYELHQLPLRHAPSLTEPRWPLYSTNDHKELLTLRQTIQAAVESLSPHIVFVSASLSNLMALSLEPGPTIPNLLLYLKVDDSPVSPIMEALFKEARMIITMSCSSKSLIENEFTGLPVLKCIYPAADTRRFRPAKDKFVLRKTLLPTWMPRDAFLLGWIGRPYWRKQVWLLYKVIHSLRTGDYSICSHCNEVTAPELAATGYTPSACVWCGTKALRKAEPLRDIYLWLHMPEHDQGAAWLPTDLERVYSVKRNRDVCYTDGVSSRSALSDEDMPFLYQLWDCLLFLSGSEGFGLPAWEAMSSGLPVIYTNYSAVAEYVNQANAGLPVAGILQPELKTGFWRMIADPSLAIRAVRTLYFQRKLGVLLGRNGRRFAKLFGVKTQVAQWHRLFKEFSLSTNQP